MPDPAQRPRATGRGPRRGPDPLAATAGLAVLGIRLTASVGRFALASARLAVRAPLIGPDVARVERSLASQTQAAGLGARARAEQAVAEVLASPELERSIDRALAGPLTDAVARSLAENRTIERVARETLRTPEFEDALASALDDVRTQEVVQRTLASPGLERMLLAALESQITAEVTSRVLRSPELQSALRSQSATYIGELCARLRRRLLRIDEAAERSARRLMHRAGAGPRPYGGIATRAVALTLDLALAGLLAIVGLAALTLVASLVGGIRPAWLAGLIAGFGWLAVAGGYLVFFWTVAGQTPAMRWLELRVCGPRGEPPGLGRSIVRLVGVGLAIIPLFAGFLPVLVDARRRGLQDFLAGTVVLTEGPVPRAALPPASER